MINATLIFEIDLQKNFPANVVWYSRASIGSVKGFKKNDYRDFYLLAGYTQSHTASPLFNEKPKR